MLAGLLRFVRLSDPSSLVFDETYYAKDACLYTGHTQEFCASTYRTEVSWVHPPLGKWLIAAGIRIFGYNAFGWRSTAAAFGAALAILAFLLARKLFNDRWVAGAAGFLTATDFLLIVQSRVAMLDIFEAFFVLLGFLFLALDRERILLLREHARLPFPGAPPRRMPEWRFLAGAALGAGVAVKWQAVFGLAVAMLLAFSWSASLWGRGRLRQRLDGGRRALSKELGATALAFVALPLLTYALSYAAWFSDNYPHHCAEGQTQRLFLLNTKLGCREGALGTALAFGELHNGMLDFHTGLKAEHPYASRAYEWPLVVRPVAYHYQGEPKSQHVLALGNPATWWAALGAGVWLLVRSVRSWRAERLVIAGWLGQYLPWLVLDRPAVFIFYMTPIVPFMMVGLAAGLGAVRELGRVGRWIVLAYLVLGVGVLLWFFYPVIAAVGIPYEWWRNRMWLGSWI